MRIPNSSHKRDAYCQNGCPIETGLGGSLCYYKLFSERVQREIIEDSYPILLINGKKIAEIALKIVHDDGYPSLASFLADVDTQYEIR